MNSKLNFFIYDIFLNFKNVFYWFPLLPEDDDLAGLLPPDDLEGLLKLDLDDELLLDELLFIEGELLFELLGEEQLLLTAFGLDVEFVLGLLTVEFLFVL
jgi:hypothetical protein